VKEPPLDILDVTLRAAGLSRSFKDSVGLTDETLIWIVKACFKRNESGDANALRFAGALLVNHVGVAISLGQADRMHRLARAVERIGSAETPQEDLAWGLMHHYLLVGVKEVSMREIRRQWEHWGKKWDEAAKKRFERLAKASGIAIRGKAGRPKTGT